MSIPVTNARPPQAAAETAAAKNAAQTLAAALNSGQHNEAITDPRLNVSLDKLCMLSSVSTYLENPRSSACTCVQIIFSKVCENFIGLQMAAAGPATNEEIASQLMMPQGIDLSSLGNLAAVLGVSQGLNLLVGKQQGTLRSALLLPS